LTADGLQLENLPVLWHSLIAHHCRVSAVLSMSVASGARFFEHCFTHS